MIKPLLWLIWRGRRLSGRHWAVPISLWLNFQEAFIMGDGTKIAWPSPPPPPSRFGTCRYRYIFVLHAIFANPLPPSDTPATVCRALWNPAGGWSKCGMAVRLRKPRWEITLFHVSPWSCRSRHRRPVTAEWWHSFQPGDPEGPQQPSQHCPFSAKGEVPASRLTFRWASVQLLC